MTQQRRVLMCSPEHYGLKYEINPWMHLEDSPDTMLAMQQWQGLYNTLTVDLGVQVDLVDQAEECPDMVFTANAGLVRGKQALLARFRHPQRQLEEPHFASWFEANGFEVLKGDAGCYFEGEGDALFVGSTLLAGYLKRSDICGHRWMADCFETSVLSLELVDDRWYHLDTCLFPINADTVVYYPGAFDPYAQSVIHNSFNTLVVPEEEALRFCCNAVVIGDHVVLPTGCPVLCAELAERGYQPHQVEMSEFLKAGGAAKCLTLLLDNSG